MSTDIKSVSPVVKSLESEAAWEQHRAGMMASLAPEGALEQSLAERAASLSWRLDRVTRHETALLNVRQEDAERDYAASPSFRDRAWLAGPASTPEQVIAYPKKLRDAVSVLECLQGLPPEALVRDTMLTAFV